MPLKKGTDRKTTESNFREFGAGKTYRHTKKRFGKKRADRQRIALVLSNKRKSKHRTRKNRRQTRTR